MLSLPFVVDRLAAEAPEEVWAKVAMDEHATAWQDITWRQLSSAVNKMARWMEDEIGLGTGDEPVVFAGTNDIRYYIVMLAALKTRYKVRCYLRSCPTHNETSFG